jgi:ferredoxin
MHVSINEEKCQGHARCEAICPEVFSLDEEGYSHVLQPDVPAELEASALLAIRNCPEGAILARDGAPADVNG